MKIIALTTQIFIYILEIQVLDIYNRVAKKLQQGGLKVFLSAYELNDNITVRLDLNNNRLSFGKNNGDITVSHSSLPSDSGEIYRLAASIGDDGDKFRIISHTTNP